MELNYTRYQTGIRTRSLCLSRRSVWVCLGVLAWISPSRCLSVKEGHRLEVFAYKLIWRSARLSLSTEGKESDAFGLMFPNQTIKFINSNGPRKRSSRKEHKCKMSTSPPFSLLSPSFLFFTLLLSKCKLLTLWALFTPVNCGTPAFLNNND